MFIALEVSSINLTGKIFTLTKWNQVSIQNRFWCLKQFQCDCMVRLLWLLWKSQNIEDEFDGKNFFRWKTITHNHYINFSRFTAITQKKKHKSEFNSTSEIKYVNSQLKNSCVLWSFRHEYNLEMHCFHAIVQITSLSIRVNGNVLLSNIFSWLTSFCTIYCTV